MHAWIVALFDWILPRHTDARRARRVSEDELASLMAPDTLPNKKWIHFLWPYQDARVRAMVKAVKYYGERDVAAKFGALAADYLLEVLEEQRAFQGWGSAVIVPIPSSQKRLRERGYNQAARLAEAIVSNIDGVRYKPELLTREDRESQVQVERSKRVANIAGAFAASPAAKGLFIIIIDDVVESGATLADARRALLDAGVKGVIALAMAH